MKKLVLRPNSSGYTVTAGNEVVNAATQGGGTRSRRDFIGAPSMVSVGWMLDENGFEYLNAFFRTVTEAGSLPFICDLLLDHPYLVSYICKFVPGSFKPVSSTAAFTFNAVANFEVLPEVPNADFDNAFVDAYEFFGGNVDLLNRFSRLANIVMPDNIGP